MAMASLRPALLAILSACAYSAPPCESGYERDAAGTCQALPGDTGTDSTSATATGDLTGALSIAVLAKTGGIELTDECVGSVGLTVDDVTIDGTLSCAFTETIAGVVGDEPFSGTVQGTVDTDTASGDLYMDLGDYGALEATWTGAVSDEGIEGSFADETIFSVKTLEVPVSYSGSFVATGG